MIHIQDKTFVVSIKFFQLLSCTLGEVTVLSISMQKSIPACLKDTRCEQHPG